MSIASVAAQQNSATANAAATTTSGSSAASQTGSAALNSLSANFGDFLNMLMTQLQNQDPSSPMDTNQFTTELVQFSSVEQQIDTNTSLTQLIQLTQSGEVMQASAMTGKQVTVTSDHVPLQNGQGTVQFTTPSAEPVDIAIYDANGNKLTDNMMMSSTGSNSWSWNGTNSTRRDGTGRQLQGGCDRREFRWHHDHTANQRRRHRDRCAEPVDRHAAGAGRAVGQFLTGAVGGKLRAIMAPCASTQDGRPP